MGFALSMSSPSVFSEELAPLKLTSSMDFLVPLPGIFLGLGVHDSFFFNTWAGFGDTFVSKDLTVLGIDCPTAADDGGGGGGGGGTGTFVLCGDKLLLIDRSSDIFGGGGGGEENFGLFA